MTTAFIQYVENCLANLTFHCLNTYEKGELFYRICVVLQRRLLIIILTQVCIDVMLKFYTIIDTEIQTKNAQKLLNALHGH